MHLLLETHVLLWWLDDPTQLSEAASGAIRDGGTNLGRERERNLGEGQP